MAKDSFYNSGYNSGYNAGVTDSKVYKLGSCTSEQTFNIATIVGAENVGKYSASNFLIVVSDSSSTSAVSYAGENQIGRDATAIVNFTAPSVKYNTSTGVATVSGGNYSISVSQKNGSNGTNSVTVTKIVYFFKH